MDVERGKCWRADNYNGDDDGGGDGDDAVGVCC